MLVYLSARWSRVNLPSESNFFISSYSIVNLIPPETDSAVYLLPDPKLKLVLSEILEPKVLFYVPEHRRLSDAASCHGNRGHLLCWLCQRSALLPWPLPSVAAHFPPGGFHIQHLPCTPLCHLAEPPTTKATELLDWLFSIKAIRAHLLRGSEVMVQAGTHCYDLQSSSLHPLLRLTEKTLLQLVNDNGKTSSFIIETHVESSAWGIVLQHITSPSQTTFPCHFPRMQRLAAPSCDRWMVRQKEWEFPLVSIRACCSACCLVGP